MNQNISKSQILNELKQYKNFNSNVEFAKYLGITPQNLSQWFARDSFDVNIVASKFPNVNTEWLLTGNGEMLKPISHSNDLADFYRKRHEDAENTHRLVKRQGELILEYSREMKLLNKQIGTMLLMIGMLANELKRVDPQNELAEKASKFLDSQLSQIDVNNHNNPQISDNDKD